MSSRKGARSIPLVNGGLATALVLVLSAVALVVNPPAPPGIAEFAPQATRPISKAPLTQAAGRGGPGAGHGCTAAGACPVPTASASARASLPPGSPLRPRRVATTLQCYAWPDGSVTQTFDPQSPPCIATWDDRKGNGGATSPGVSGSEIRVVVPGRNSLSPSEQATVAFFNARFMLYGRKLRVLPVSDEGLYSGPQGEPSPEGYRAVARKAAALGPFASFVPGPPFEPDGAPYVEQLAQSKVVTATATVNYLTQSLQARLAPYSWSYLPPVDTALRNVGALACSALVGRPAKHGGPDVAGKPRKFALAVYKGTAVDTKPLTDALAGCGSPVRVVTIDTSGPPGDPALTQQFLQLKTDGYTTVITLDWTWSVAMGQPASNAGYFPEWLIAGVGNQAAEGQFVTEGHREQLRNAFGLGTWDKLQAWASEPWFEASSEMGVQPTVPELTGRAFYDALQVIASGIQLAGPHLTPATFASGLATTTFPNPGAGAAPSWQAAVGITSGHSMVNDMSLVWWNDSARDYTQSAGGASGGGWCYLDRGRRFSAESWPKDDPPMPRSGAC